MFFSNRKRLADLAMKHRLPTIVALREYAAAEGLISYGADNAGMFRGAAVLVDKILNIIRQSLRDLGWIEGQTVIFAPRYAQDKANKLPALATELVRIPVDVLLTVGTAATQSGEECDEYDPNRDVR
jgi:hypothetical protein